MVDSGGGLLFDSNYTERQDEKKRTHVLDILYQKIQNNKNRT